MAPVGAGFGLTLSPPRAELSYISPIRGLAKSVVTTTEATVSEQATTTVAI